MISVVIPNLHSPLIDRVVQALEQQKPPKYIREIIIVGQDRYGRVPCNERVRFVQTPHPTPHGTARNIGARMAQSDYVLFLDADCIAHPDLVERIVNRHQEGLPVVGGGLALESGNYWARCDNALVFAPFLATGAAGPRSRLPSYNLGIQRDLFLALDGFDETLSVVGEDTDLSLRLRQHGYTLFCEPGAAVDHQHARTSPGAVWEHLRRFGRQHATFWVRYPGLLAPHRNAAHLRRLAPLILAGSVLLALYDVLRLYRQTPGLRRAWYLLPGMVWGKMAWYWGLAESLMLQQEDGQHAA
jgi:GT2 family glycosyltransferase